jgi:tyrosine-specific transport protein
MNTKMLGGILLIVGTSIGGGMLALPMATAAGGFMHASLLFLGVWAVTVVAAFLLLEVNLALPEGTNMVSMAKKTLGPLGQVITWLFYLLLLYALICAYIAAGGDLLHSVMTTLHIQLSSRVSAVCFALLFATVVFFGIRVVDITNRFLMSFKLAAYVALVFFIDPHVRWPELLLGRVHLLWPAVLVAVTSFGYSVIIPSLRSYFDSDVKQLRRVLAIGSLIPLVCYLLWDLAVQGSVPHATLQQIAASPHAISYLTAVLSLEVHSRWLSYLVHFFTYVCVTTSFLGVSLCMTDFLTDGLQWRKQGWQRWCVMCLTYLPPLLIVMLYPNAFVKALAYAGLFCVVLLMLLPGLMCWQLRYVRQLPQTYQFFGGKTVVTLEIGISIVLILMGLLQLHW